MIFSKIYKIGFITLFLGNGILPASYAIAAEREDYNYMDIGSSFSSGYIISVEGTKASYRISPDAIGGGELCDPNDFIMCISLSGLFDFAFPKNPDHLTENRSYTYGDFRFQITDTKPIDWFNTNVKHLFYYIDGYRIYDDKNITEKLANRFVFSCEDGLQMITKVADIEGGTVADGAAPYKELYGELNASILRPIGKALFAGQCTEDKKEEVYAPVQLEKGYICGMEVGHNIRELLYDGADVTVKRTMVEGNYYLTFYINIEQCGKVEIQVDDNDIVDGLSTSLTGYTTKEGARVGMTLKEVKALYPDGQLSARFFTDATSLYSFYLPEDQGQFDFDGTGIQEKCGKSLADCGPFLDELKSVRFFTY